MNFLNNLIPYPAEELVNGIFRDFYKGLFKNLDLVKMKNDLISTNKLIIESLDIDTDILNDIFMKGYNLTIANIKVSSFSFNFPKSYHSSPITLSIDDIEIEVKFKEKDFI